MSEASQGHFNNFRRSCYVKQYLWSLVDSDTNVFLILIFLHLIQFLNFSSRTTECQDIIHKCQDIIHVQPSFAHILTFQVAFMVIK